MTNERDNIIKLDQSIDINETSLMTGIILTHTNAGNRVNFLVPAGRGKDYIARIRVMISRTRVNMRNNNKRVKQFIFRAESHPCTDLETGKRHDSVWMWQEQTMVHKMVNELMKAL